MSTVQMVGEWQTLEYEGSLSLHQIRFARADGHVVGCALRHVVLGTDPKEEVWCEIGLIQWEPWYGYRPLFTVINEPGDKISLSPMIHCEICGDCGEITNGKWIPGASDAPGIESMQVIETDDDQTYVPMVRRDLGDKVEAEEKDADNKIVDLFATGEIDPDLEAILREEEELERSSQLWRAMNDAQPGETMHVHMGGGKTSLRKELLDRVAGYILGDRNIAYGPPHIDFQRTAEMLTALWKWKLAPGAAIEAHDIANVVTLIKLSRIQWSPEKQDNWDDGAGYFACGWEAYVETHPEVEIKK